MTTICIEIDNEIAQSFSQASTAEKQRIQLFVNLCLKELLGNPKQSLLKILDEMGNYAQKQGMTPELLAALLNEK